MTIILEFWQWCNSCKKETKHSHIDEKRWKCDICSTGYRLKPSHHLEDMREELYKYAKLLF